ncbi:MAG: CpsD/CapB family tyrosine-protein kinase, partial [Halobacteriales archaeon]|nr:CpsD/CapB family tyrosine-protein kinase [Halobacteriales archaeon]
IAELDAQLAAEPGNLVAEAERTAAINRLVALNTRIEQITTNAALYGSGVQLYVPPELPESPVQPSPLRNSAAAAVLGLLAASAWAWWRAERDERDSDRNVPARVLQAPLLAVVPEFSEAGVHGPAPTVNEPGSSAAEAYQFAVSSLGFALDAVSGKTVLITSASPGDGKSVTALNLAVAATKDGRRPLLIDADERERGLTRLAGFRNETGISDLGNGVGPSDVIHHWGMTDGTGLRFVPAGRDLEGNAASYFRSVEFRERLPKLFVDSDLVLIDSPPVMSAAETTDLAARVDGAVLVVPKGASLRDLDDARVRLSLAGVTILGYVYNRAQKSGGYGYGYGYGYGQQMRLNNGGRHIRG